MRTKVEEGWKVYDNIEKCYVESLVVWADDQTHTFGFCHCVAMASLANSLIGTNENLQKIKAQCTHPDECSAYRVLILPEMKMVWLNVPEERAEKKDDITSVIQELREDFHRRVFGKIHG